MLRSLTGLASLFWLLCLAPLFAAVALSDWLGIIDGLAPRVTCEGLRSLALDMSESDVEYRLGPPYRSGPTVTDGAGRPTTCRTFADFSPRARFAGGIRLSVDFCDHRMERASVYVKTFNDDRGRSLFVLDEDHRYDSPEFERRVCRKTSESEYSLLGTYGRRRLAAAGVLLTVVCGCVRIVRWNRGSLGARMLRNSTISAACVWAAATMFITRLTWDPLESATLALGTLHLGLGVPLIGHAVAWRRGRLKSGLSDPPQT